MLANPLCYEIMTPASVGLSQSYLVLGKHSGRHAVESRLKQLGVVLKADEVEDVTRKVKELADRTKFVYDEDLLAIVEHAAEPRAKLVRYQVVAGNQILPTATVEVEIEGDRAPVGSHLRGRDRKLGDDLLRAQAARAQLREGLRRRHLVDEMQVDVDDRRRLGRLRLDEVGLPDLGGERARALHASPPMPPLAPRAPKPLQRCRP